MAKLRELPCCQNNNWIQIQRARQGFEAQESRESQQYHKDNKLNRLEIPKRTHVIPNPFFNSTSHKNLASEILTVTNQLFPHLHFVLVTTRKLLTPYPSVKWILQHSTWSLVPGRMRTGPEERHDTEGGTLVTSSGHRSRKVLVSNGTLTETQNHPSPFPSNPLSLTLH